MKKIKRSGSLFYDDDDIDMMEIQVNLVIAAQVLLNPMIDTQVVSWMEPLVLNCEKT